MPKSSLRWIVCGAIMLGAIGWGVRPALIAQDAAKGAEKGEEAKGAKGAKKAKSDVLPKNYGKIGLSEEQRKKVYEIQERYEAQIDELEKKLAELKSKQAADCEAVLNPNQRQSLKDLNEEAKKKASSKKKEATKTEGKAEDSGQEKGKSDK